MKRFIITLLLTVTSLTLICAQSNISGGFEQFRNEQVREFEEFKQQKKTEFEQFRQRLNAEYAAMLGKQWHSYKQEPSKQPSPLPKPVNPGKVDPNVKPGVVSPSEVVQPERPIPDVPVTLPKISKIKKKTYPINFLFFNTQCGINKFDTSLLALNGIDNKSLSAAWSGLTDNGATDNLIEDCLRLREEMKLCDWGYLLLIEKVAQILYPKSKNSQVFLTVALLNQSGYDSRLCANDRRLLMMFHPSHDIYSCCYYTIDGKRYYLREDLSGVNTFISTYDGNYCDSPTPIRMVMDRYPEFDFIPDDQRVFSSSSWELAPPFETSVNPSVIEFLDTYPLMDWHLYGLSPISDALRTSLFPAFEILTEGLDNVEAVNLLLSFHNHAFKYMTDQDQFGKEKPFFFDENFFYPYNDCEDRAIMFAKLVNSILGLDVVYLKYPRHLAAAVRFPEDTKISGSTVDVDGQTYYVCDPTCIGAPVGYLAPQYLNSKPTVYKIKL